MNKERIKIVEVGPRDGLQNETIKIATNEKINFINRLSDTGLKHIEVSSFVNPKYIPQLADATEVFKSIKRNPNIKYSALVPNEQGLLRALDSKPNSIAVFTAVSETFCKKNINCTIEESLHRFEPILKLAEENNIPVRAYISCVLGCPYEGYIQPEKVSEISQKLISMGCCEISLGDTIGAGTPLQARTMLRHVSDYVSMDKLAVHFHDTRGQALANIHACLDLGIRTVDSSVAGLGGCPYAEGATGNVATEDVVYMLHGMGYSTGIDLGKIIHVGQSISAQLNRSNNSRVGSAGVPYDYKNYQIAQ